VRTKLNLSAYIKNLEGLTWNQSHWNLLAIILIVIWILLAIRGYRRGALGMLAGIIGCILAIFFIPGLLPKIQTAISSNQTIVNFVHGKALSYVSKKGQGISLQLPQTFQDGFHGSFQSAADQAVSAAQNEIQNVLANTITEIALRGIAMILTILLAGLIVFLVRMLMRTIDHVPVVHGISHFIGILIGIFEGYLLICLFLYLIMCFSGTEWGGNLQSLVQENSVLIYMEEHNLISFLFTR
jgi:uncharacterized membrane protein required for colicin V production